MVKLKIISLYNSYGKRLKLSSLEQLSNVFYRL